MKILIISGFLGAGKTTFIKEMVKATKREYVIFENEFADINIDKDLLQNPSNPENQELEIWEFTNGCICCNMSGDFTSSLLVIQNTLTPDFLIIEPSGVGVLSSIEKAIKDLNYEHLQLLNPITIVDVKTFDKYKVKHKDIFLDQIKNTAAVQFSKLEGVAQEDIDRIAQEIKEINPEVVIHSTPYKEQDAQYWNNLFAGELVKEIDENNLANSTLENLSFKDAQVGNLVPLVNFLTAVTHGVFGDICRGKGVFKTPEYNLRFDIVDNTFAITFAEDHEENHVIFIGNNLKRLNLTYALVNLKNSQVNVTIKE